MSKKQKMTNQELDNLTNIVNKSNELKKQLAIRTLEKEERIRHINYEYDILYNKVNDELRYIEKQQKEAVLELHKKYGKDKEFDIGSGEIKKQK